MLVRPYRPEDKTKLLDLFRQRNMSETLIDDLPMFGLVALRDQQMVAFGALREVEGKRALLDSFITDGTFSPEIRRRALDLIAYKLIKIADVHKLKQLVIISAEHSILDRSKVFGFRPLKAFELMVRTNNET